MRPRYACDGCGSCCRGRFLVEADWVDALREPRLLSADISGDPVPLETLEDPLKAILLAGLVPCQFVGPDHRCTIYPTRPNVCVAFEAGSEPCQRVRQNEGLAALEPIQAQPTEGASLCAASR